MVKISSALHSFPFHAPCLLLLLALATANSFMALANPHPIDRTMNVIDQCWRWDDEWYNHRQHLARCSVGYAGKMTGNIGRSITKYVVTDSSDEDPANPKPGTLRYGVSRMTGIIWITFSADMKITLKLPLVIGNHTTLDGRGARIHIRGGACLVVAEVSNVIIHGLNIHDCKVRPGGYIMAPGWKPMKLGNSEGDAIRVLSSTKVWIDHNTLAKSADGLVDVTLGSTDITISNNRFHHHNAVMLLGHNNNYIKDKNMRVSVVFNHFGPGCYQRMPRVRWGLAHVANNLYVGWLKYAIGGSQNPTIKSEANYFVASDDDDTKETTKFMEDAINWHLQSSHDWFENGATIQETQHTDINLNYNKDQQFKVADPRSVILITRFAGALRCHSGSKC